MKRRNRDNDPEKPGLATRVIGFVVSTFLMASLFVLWMTIIRKVIGSSDVASIIGLATGIPLTGFIYRAVDRAFSAMVILLLFILPAIMVSLIFFMG